MGESPEPPSSSTGFLTLIVPACPEAWRDALAQALSPVVDVSVQTLRGRLVGDPPFVLVSRLPISKVTAVEEVFAAQQLRCTWDDVVTLKNRLGDRAGLLAAVVFFAASVGFVVYAPWRFPQATVGMVPAAEMPAPIAAFAVDGMDKAIGLLVREATAGGGFATVAPLTGTIPGGHGCTSETARGQSTIWCRRAEDTCQAQRDWINALTNSTRLKLYAVLQQGVTGFEQWSSREPESPIPAGLCRATIRLTVPGQ